MVVSDSVDFAELDATVGFGSVMAVLIQAAFRAGICQAPVGTPLAVIDWIRVAKSTRGTCLPAIHRQSTAGATFSSRANHALVRPSFVSHFSRRFPAEQSSTMCYWTVATAVGAVNR